MAKSRVYKSVYFKDARSHGKKRNDVTLAFNTGDGLYDRIRCLSSSEIRRIIGVGSYEELLGAAEKEYRSAGNFIKRKLSMHLGCEKEDTSG